MLKNKSTLKTAIIQTDLVWENPLANRNQIEKKINSINTAIDLIILPEMFTTGFSMQPENIAETMQGKTLIWMQEVANKKQAAITGSIIIRENNNYYNRLLFVHPCGKIEQYDKRHLFSLAGEGKMYTAGSTKSIINYMGWKIQPLICYDLRFPVWARNTEGYDLLIYVANWPKTRIEAWDSLLKARAIENMSYTIGVNRIGIDNNNHEYSGHSSCYNTLGKCLEKKENGEESIIITTLDKEKQQNIREKFNFLADKDPFTFQ